MISGVMGRQHSAYPACSARTASLSSSLGMSSGMPAALMGSHSSQYPPSSSSPTHISSQHHQYSQQQQQLQQQQQQQYQLPQSSTRASLTNSSSQATGMSLSSSIQGGSHSGAPVSYVRNVRSTTPSHQDMMYSTTPSSGRVPEFRPDSTTPVLEGRQGIFSPVAGIVGHNTRYVCVLLGVPVYRAWGLQMVVCVCGGGGIYVVVTQLGVCIVRNECAFVIGLGLVFLCMCFVTRERECVCVCVCVCGSADS